MARLDVDLSDIRHQLKLHKLSYIYWTFKFYEFKKNIKIHKFHECWKSNYKKNKLAIGWTSVCLSVRLSHAGVVLLFSEYQIFPGTPNGNTPTEALNARG